MAFFSIHHIDIKGIAAAVPKKKESNWDYDQLTTAEKKLLIKYTGVESRRIATEGITTSDLCFHAAEVVMPSVAILIKSLPKSGVWMETVERIFGLLLIGAALYYLRLIISESAFIIILGLFLIIR